MGATGSCERELLPHRVRSSDVWWSEGTGGVRAGLVYYDTATGSIESEFDAIEARAKARTPPHLDVADLTTVVQFKVWPGLRPHKARQLASASPEDASAKALQKARSGDLRTALLILDALPQVGVPTASAILAAVYPDRFAVINRYVMSEVGFMATAWIREGRERDDALALLVESLTKWVVESWTAAGAGVDAYPPFVAGLQRKADDVASNEGMRYRARDIEKAIYGHFLKRTGQRVL